MKTYQKPIIEDENIKIEDICTVSNMRGETFDPFEVWGNDPE